MADVTSFVMGAAAGAIFTAAIAYPRVGRISARILAVVLLGVGAGLLVWAVLASMRGEEMNPIAWSPIFISQASEAFGWSTGMLSAGAAALVLSFLGRSN